MEGEGAQQGGAERDEDKVVALGQNGPFWALVPVYYGKSHFCLPELWVEFEFPP